VPVALLKRERFDVELACSGEEALRVMSTGHFDIVLTDWQMPNMDGLELCRHVRLEYKEDDIYLLLLTIRDTEEDRLQESLPELMTMSSRAAPSTRFWSASMRDEASPLRHRHSGSATRNNRLSPSDPLTNMPNVRFFTEQLSREIELSAPQTPCPGGTLLPHR